MGRLTCLAVGVIALAGCHKKTEPTVKDLMQHVIDPSADVVWAASGYVVDEKGVIDLSPKTAEGWAIVENKAAVLAEATDNLRLPSFARDNQKWIAFSRRLQSSAMAAKKAAHERDGPGLLRAGGNILTSCTNCHRHYVLGEQ